MFTKTLQTLGLGLGLWLLSGCSTATESCVDVNQDRIYQSLSSSYDVTTNTTSVSARMTFGDSSGTTLAMKGNCKVIHSQYSLSEGALAELTGTSYNGSATGQLLDHTFTFTDNDSKSYTNSFSIGTIAFNGSSFTLSKSTDSTVAFDLVPALGSGESIYLRVQDESDSSNQYAFTSTSSASPITVKATDLVRIVAGTKRMQLERRITGSLTQAASAGGSTAATYVSAWVAVTVN